MKKALRGNANTARCGGVKKFRPTADPFPGARDGQNLISWRRSLPLPITQFGEDQCTQFRVIVVRKHTNPHTDSGDYNTLGRSLARCNQYVVFFIGRYLYKRCSDV